MAIRVQPGSSCWFSHRRPCHWHTDGEMGKEMVDGGLPYCFLCGCRTTILMWEEQSPAVDCGVDQRPYNRSISCACSSYISEVTPVILKGIFTATINTAYVTGQLTASGVLAGTENR